MPKPPINLFHNNVICYSEWTPLGLITICQQGTKIIRVSHQQVLNARYQLTPLIAQAFRELSEYFSQQRKEFSFKFTFPNNSFTNKVLNATKTIPYGTVITYRVLAQKINHPQAYRAVARVLASNPWPIFIPCHRIIGSNQKSKGYSCGGINNQVKLLNLEGHLLSQKPHYFAYTPTDLQQLKDQDRILKTYLSQLGILNFVTKQNQSLLMTVIEMIIGQQISTKLAAQITEQLLVKLNQKPCFDLAKIDHDFLNISGLADYKKSWIIEFIQQNITGKKLIDQIIFMQEPAISKYLTEIRGIGQWSADMIRLFGLGDPNVLSFNDLGIRKAMELVYQQPIDQAFFRQKHQQLSPYGSLASHYFWAIYNKKLGK